jgi:hypothetical protein
MLQGFYKAAVHDAEHLGSTPKAMDAPFLAAIKEGRIMDFLDGLPKVAEAETGNLTIQLFPAWLMYLVFNAPVTNTDMTSAGTDVGLRGVGLSSQSSEPTYTESTNVSGYQGNSTWCSNNDVIGGYTKQKQLLLDNIEPHRVWSDEGGREGIYLRTRFLWLPSDGLMSDIRGAISQFGNDPDHSNNNFTARFGRVGRTRFKDSGGNPVTLAKTANQSFFLEHLVKLFTR